jgi:hypothetical protein
MIGRVDYFFPTDISASDHVQTTLSLPTDAFLEQNAPPRSFFFFRSLLVVFVHFL